MANSRLGVNIGADAINRFFTLKPNIAPQHQDKQPKKKANFEIHNIAGRQEKLHAGKSAQERRTSDSDNVYSVLRDPCTLKDLSLDDTYPQDTSAEGATQLNELDGDVPEPKGPDHPALDVYENYNFEHEYDPSLPITEHREGVIGMIEYNQVTIIKGATGSGKTTQVPQYILDYHREQRKYCNILVTQPRRIAAQSIAKRVSDERKWPLGNLVGYQVGRDKKVTEDTRITYVTTGVLRQKLIMNKNMNEYTHIILDEVHERDQEIDLAMLIVKKFLHTVSKHVKVILMSATMDCSIFSKYFAIQVRGKLEGAPVVSVEGKMYDVAEYYLDELQSLGEIPYQSLSEPEIPDKCYNMAKTLIMEFDRSEAESQGIEVGKKFPSKRGTVLAFLPGYPEIDALHKKLEQIEIERNLQVLILHSNITSTDQAKIFMKAEKGKRKVILSTNIAESSITVPDIKYVIDFCLVKNLETDKDTNYSSLRISWAAKSSLNQRRGRAGRVSDGECFRLITRDFHQKLPDYGVPEMQRCPLAQVVLHVKVLDIGDPCTVLKMALQPPQINDIRRTILLLKEVGALTVKQRGRINPLDGDLTFVGRVLATLPCDVRIGKLLILGHVFGCLNECLIIGAALSLKSCFARPFKKDFEAYSHKMDWARWSFSDCIAALHCYREWKYKKTNTGFGRPRGEKEWGRNHFVEIKMMHEIDQLVLDLEERLKQFNMRPTYRGPAHARYELKQNDMLILKVVICGAFYPFYFTSGDIDEQEAIKTMAGHDPCTTVVVHNVPDPGAIYTNSIASLFRQCGKGERLHFESTRCYVEFRRSPSQTNAMLHPVLPAVYLAIKMRQLRMGLQLLVSKERDEIIKRNVEARQMLSNCTSSLRTNRLTLSLANEGGREASNAMQVKLETSGYVELNVTSVIEAGHFWAHYGTQETFQLLQTLQHDINAMGGANLSRIPQGVRLHEGEPVLAMFEGEFYRAKVVSVGTDIQNQEIVTVFFLDYGNTDDVTRADLRRCPDAFLEVPYQAFECYLCNIQPLHGEWDIAANTQFANIVLNQKFVAKVYSVVQDSMRVDLYYNVGESSFHINDWLVAQGFAQKCEEPYVSKMARENAEKIDRSIRENEDLVRQIDEESRNYDIEQYDVTKINLRGPFTPYETSFYSLTCNGRFRATLVERDSVNSVFICEEPQDKHPRLMVSANVGVNATGNTLLARDTTVMPNIRGIASLMPLLFAPFAEYRINKKRTKIIGAICGLGYSDSTNSAILPEHDMEVTFDVEFSQIDVSDGKNSLLPSSDYSGNMQEPGKDLLQVNAVRKGINFAIKDEELWGTSAIEKIQRFSRKKVLELLHKKRNDTEREEFPRQYLWNQIPEIVRLEPAVEDDTISPLYTLHCGVFLPNAEDRTLSTQKRKEQQVRDLYAMAGRSIEPFPEPVICPLCTVQCNHPRGLEMHLTSRFHRQEEHLLFSAQNNAQH